MTHLWIDGDPLAVQADASGVPAHLTWHNQRHAVNRIANQWRVDEGWWFNHVQREYFKLTTSTGLLLTIYHDLIADSWYVQRLYD